LQLVALAHNPTLNFVDGAFTSLPVEGFLLSDSLIALLAGFSTAPQGFVTLAHNLIGGEQIKNLLLISSLFSLLVGTIGGLSQIKIKRLLAFSSISHVGFLLLALGIYTQNSVDSFIFYLVQYTITSLNIFLILLALGYNRLAEKSLAFSRLTDTNEIEDRKNHAGPAEDMNYLIELKGQLYKNPVLSISLAICLFSMAGLPPLIGFFSKQFVLFSSIENGNNFLSIIAILVSVISASYYLKVIKITFFDNPSLSASATHNTDEESFVRYLSAGDSSGDQTAAQANMKSSLGLLGDGVTGTIYKKEELLQENSLNFNKKDTSPSLASFYALCGRSSPSLAGDAMIKAS
jgi:formate hydrogenlyase subunit 3/multisubunit Na+/H+ antiporter MnhD subunit